MQTGRSIAIPLLRETLLALLVLGLVFLNFGHTAASASGEFRFVADSWCGDPLLPGQRDHAPCHACRIGGGADLPPPAATVLPVIFAVTPVVYAAPPALRLAPQMQRPTLPRGPPVLV